jgi:hypothetical protein
MSTDGSSGVQEQSDSHKSVESGNVTSCTDGGSTCAKPSVSDGSTSQLGTVVTASPEKRRRLQRRTRMVSETTYYRRRKPSHERDHGREHEPWPRERILYAQRFCAFAGLCSSINEKASLFYHKVHKIGLVVLAVLTVVVGSKGVLAIQGSTRLSTSVNVFLVLCDLLLAILAGLMSTLSWHSKAVAYAKRSSEYTAMAVRIRAELMDTSQLSDPSTYLRQIMKRVTELENMTDPLPLRYRKEADIRRGIISMWASGGFPASAVVGVGGLYRRARVPLDDGGVGVGLARVHAHGKAAATQNARTRSGADTIVDMSNVNTFHDMSMRLNLEALNEAELAAAGSLDEATLEGCVREFGDIFLSSGPR